MVSEGTPALRMDTVRVAIYARQPKARPDASEASPGGQVAACEAEVVSRSAGGGARWEVVHTFMDVGRSGWDPKVVRHGFDNLMAAVRAGEVDVVTAHELSRLTRRGAHDALEVDKDFRKYGVRFVSAREPFLDTSSPIVGGRHSSSAPYGMRAVREKAGPLVVSGQYLSRMKTTRNTSLS